MLFVMIVMGMFRYNIRIGISLIIIINSTGCNDGISRQCTECDGAGIETLLVRMGPIIQQMRRKCSKCGGHGNMTNNHNRCRNCGGKGLSNQQKRVIVNIVNGSQDGEFIKFTGEGNQIVRFFNNLIFFYSNFLL